MAEKLLMYYKYMGEEVGAVGKVKLAQETKVPSTRAALEPDTPELIQQFREAVMKLTGKPAPNY
jgi:hypothetical protein